MKSAPLRVFFFFLCLIAATVAFTTAHISAVNDACTPPGLLILTDPTGDAGVGGAPDPEPGHDVQSLSIAEPGSVGPGKIMFTIKVASLASVPPDTNWPVQFKVGALNYVARMSTVAPATPAAPRFEYYQGTWNSLLLPNQIIPADAASNFNPDGTITIVVPRGGVGNPAVGSNLTEFLVRISVFIGAGFVTPDNMPDNLVPSGSYTVVGSGSCGGGGTPTPTPTPTPTATPTPGPGAGAPRYFNYYSPFADFAGEPSIGSNWGSETNSTNNNIDGSTNSIPNGGNSHYYGGFFDYMLKASWDDCPSPANPNFEKKPVLLAGTPRAFGDPILFTDNHTPGQHARTFVSQLEGLTPAGSTTDITDDDGATFHPSEGSGLPSHIDHQTFGGGPFRTNSVPPPPPHPTYPNAIYYCSQNVSDAACSLSIDGGVTFGPAVPIYTVADCAGLHGHLKVAPDGTVYVPNKACAVNGVPLLLGGNAAVVVSEDNGITWDIRPVPDDKGGQSAGEWDSSVGVATDGTIYLGYQDINNHARIAVSHDRGLTWNQSVDVGVPSASVKVDDVDANGIENMVFPEVVAGDPNRAAFAFYGSDKSDAEGGDHSGGGNNDPNLFTGVWYQYIASTFDGGATWTTVNSTPNDPIQRGSICHDSTCRNLLDFFDIQVDKQGRVLVAGQDGCIGGCVNGPPNSFTAQAFITRQSGGKRLFAAFDPAEPIRPGAPKVTGSANDPGTIINLTWPVPDHGGATITSYNIYRKFGGGAFNLIATVSNNSFTDATFTAPASENSYRVTAVNSQGEGPYCGTVVPVIGGATPCIEPGIIVVDDTNANGSDNDAEQNMPPDGSVNIRLLRVAEPFLGHGVKKLIFTLQVAPSLLTDPPPNSQWIIVWNRIGGVAADGSDRRYVAMVSDDAGNLTFDYGDFGPALPLDGSIPPPNANAPTRLGEADSGTYDIATGVIRIVLSTSKAENIAAGQTLAGLNVRTYFNRPDYPGFQRSQNNASDITGNGNYTLVGNDLPAPGCLINQLPTAVLDGSPTSGNSPLVVNFNGAGSTDPDPGDSISAYIFTFGDGTSDVEQPGSTLAHTYTCPGPPDSQSTCNFFASLRVKDQSGALSANTAVVPIQVNATTQTPNTPPTANLQASPTSGNAPLQVRFDGDGSTDPDFNDVIASYRFSFGDGAPDAVQGSPVVEHTYAAAGTYTARLVVTDSRGASSQNSAERVITVTQSAPSPTPTATPTATPGATPVNVQLLNISGRVFAQSNDKVGIGGFIISGTGSGTKRIMARAIGPSMTVNGVPVPGRLQNPYLELHDNTGSPPLINDNWRDAQEAEIQQSGLAPSDDRESAVIKRLPAGNYTAIIRGADGSPGIGLVELYDLSSTEPGELGNLSVRADVGTDDNVLIDGLILRGGNPKRVLFRALGPSVKSGGTSVPGALQNPSMELFDGNGTRLGSNDDWQDASNASEIQTTGLAPPDDRESAILLSVTPGNYTAVVRGVNRTTGIALAEAYKLNN